MAVVEPGARALLFAVAEGLLTVLPVDARGRMCPAGGDPEDPGYLGDAPAMYSCRIPVQGLLGLSGVLWPVRDPGGYAPAGLPTQVQLLAALGQSPSGAELRIAALNLDQGGWCHELARREFPASAHDLCALPCGFDGVAGPGRWPGDLGVA